MEQNTGMINKKILLIHRKIPALCIAMLFFLVLVVTSGCNNNGAVDNTAPDLGALQSESAGMAPDELQNGNDLQEENGTPGAVGDVVDIEEGSEDKMVAVALEAVGRANPFVPVNDTSVLEEKIVPKVVDLPKLDLVEPPMGSETDSDAAKIVTTKISGIMFDKYNPSAILNIEGSDYLVRSGDVINGYKVLAISPKTVTVQRGSNVYKAGVGEVVAKDEGITYNKVSNLSKKFGGAKK